MSKVNHEAIQIARDLPLHLSHEVHPRLGVTSILKTVSL
ncbi:uncharacterized protein METZ01_LOCUS58385 [marine metagenome]|uniref:Uncharacterized protein n=1 Tax=marine metagenome TaxID=408172 RepID=A0A381SQC3_9ZZZZ